MILIGFHLVFALLFLSCSSQNDSIKPIVMFSYETGIRMVGGNLKNSQTLIENKDGIGSFDFLLDKNLIFYVDKQKKSINVLNRNRKPFLHKPVVQNEIQAVECLSVDWVGRNLYWVDIGAGRLEVSDLDGTNRVQLNKKVKDVSALALAPLKRLMFIAYWSKPNSYIEVLSMDGEEQSEYPLITETIASSLAVDHLFEKLYWADQKVMQVYSSNFDGSYKRLVLKEAKPYSISVHQDKVFWVDLAMNSIFSSDKLYSSQSRSLLQEEDKRTIQLIRVFNMKEQPQPSEKHPCVINNGGCSHQCLLSFYPPYYTCKCPTGIRLNFDGHNCSSQVEHFLLVTQAKQLGMISLDVQHKVNQPLIASKIGNAVAVDYDPITQIVYWADQGKKSINRAYLNGSNERLVVTVADGKLENIALDWYNQNVYWIMRDPNAIMVASVSRKNASNLLIYDELGKPRGLAVHPTAGLLFWADYEFPAKIERVLLDGSDRRTLVTKDLAAPNSLAVDLTSNRLYWCDYSLSRVESIALDGTNRQPLFQLEKEINLFSISVLGNTAYLSDFGKQTIYSTDLTKPSINVVIDRVQNLLTVKAATRSLVEKAAPTSVCAVENDCEHLCFFLPNKGQTCTCLRGFQLNNDNRSCALGMNSCYFNNGNCSQKCYQLRGDWHECACEEGYILNKNGHDCDPSPQRYTAFDTPNLCNLKNCSHECDSSPSSTTCSCPTGMTLAADGLTCLKIIAPLCNESQFECLIDMETTCIELRFRCDGVFNCQNGTDEINCESICPIEHFRCSDGSCVENSELCISTNSSQLQKSTTNSPVKRNLSPIWLTFLFLIIALFCGCVVYRFAMVRPEKEHREASIDLARRAMLTDPDNCSPSIDIPSPDMAMSLTSGAASSFYSEVTEQRHDAYYDRDCITGASCSSESQKGFLTATSPINFNPYPFPTVSSITSSRPKEHIKPRMYPNSEETLCPYAPPPTPLGFYGVNAQLMSTDPYALAYSACRKVLEAPSPPSSSTTMGSYNFNEGPPPSPVTERSFNKFH